jgi:hypothetical protein
VGHCGGDGLWTGVAGFFGDLVDGEHEQGLGDGVELAE